MDLKEIFHSAAELPAARRAAFLDEHCGGDPGMRAQVEQLLAAHDRAGAFMAEPTVAAARLAPATPPSFKHALPRQIGPYKLLQELGEGGFGSVYLAEQEHPVRRRVALKLIKVGMDTRTVIARFEAERQALALMDHPNIARVYDAGQTDDGRPYFAMELVKGIPVTDFCDQKKLDIRARLALFAQVCHAVQHAHQKGLIHRDIKPSNVLVAEADAGQPPLVKVIDFGIAKATQSRLTEKTLFTEFRQLVGTPEYMSPEQAEGSLDIDTRTDVYALGVLLYELLCGTTPFDARALRSKAFAEMQRLIREVEPPKPSTRLVAMRDTLPSVAAQRAVEPHRLRTLVRGELDWIVMRALEKDRARRYETASALAADVQRYLADEPVLAGPPSKVYRVRKFVRRHRGGVGAAVAILAILIAALVVSLQLYVTASRALKRAVVAEADANRQRDDAVRARDAEAEARTLTEEADNFLRDMFNSIDPVEARGKPVLVRDVLDRAVDKLKGAFPDRPGVEGRLRGFFGATYLVLGLPEKARAQLEDANGLLFAAVGDADPEYVHNLVDLGRCYQFLDRIPEAQQLFQLADERAPRAYGRDAPAAYVPKSHLASILMRQNKVAEASELLDELLAFRLRTLGPSHTQTLTTMGDIAWARQLQGRFAEAEAIMVEAVATAKQTLGPDHPRTGALMNNLAQAQADNGKLDQAERTQREVVALARRLYGLDHRNALAAAGIHAQFLTRLGRYDEAEALLNDSIDRLGRTLGEDHSNTLLNRSQRAQLYVLMDRLDEADRELADIVQRIARVLGPEHPETLTVISLRSQVVARRRDYARAEPMYADLVPRMSKAFGPNHPSTLGAASWWAYVLGRQNKWPQAEPIIADAYARAARSGLTKKQPSYAVGYGECLANLGKTAQAAPLLREADDVMRRQPRPEPALRRRLDEAMSLIGVIPAQPSTVPTTNP
jgi:serine/threonine protein kinase/tetratricopeptide (TPR) repeat protein